MRVTLDERIRRARKGYFDHLITRVKVVSDLRCFHCLDDVENECGYKVDVSLYSTDLYPDYYAYGCARCFPRPEDICRVLAEWLVGRPDIARKLR